MVGAADTVPMLQPDLRVVRFLLRSCEVSDVRQTSERQFAPLLLRAGVGPLAPMNPAVRTVLRWTGIVVAALVLLLILGLTFMDWNLLKHPIERLASASSGREVRIAGDLRVRVWSWAPTITVNQLTVGNPPWEAGRPMLQIQRLEASVKLLPLLEGQIILPRLVLTRPEVYLHQDRSGRANWTFENKAPTNAPNSRPTKLPVIRGLFIQSGTLHLADDIRKLKVEGTLAAGETQSRQDPTPFKVEGKGTINNEPFLLRIAGGALVNLDPDHPYPFKLNMTSGDIQVESDGKVLEPFKLGKLDFEVTLSGKDLAEGFYLTQLALPNTPPFRLHVRIERNGNRIAVRDIAGKVGESDLGGTLDVDATRKRPDVTGDLVSDRLRLKDLAASLGTKTQEGGTLDQPKGSQRARPEPRTKAPPSDPNARLFPDSKLQVERVRAMDADVRLRAKSIEAGTIPIKAVTLHVKLDNGLLSIDPFSMQMPEGRLNGEARIDARESIPKVRIDAQMRNIQLDQLKGKSPGATPPLDGVMQARLLIEGRGDSLHRVMSDADGTLTLVLPHGDVRSAFAELTGINVAKGLGLLLKGDQDKAPIRCGVAEFGIKDGTMRADNITFDTQNVKITGKGDIRLGPEELDLEIKGDPKKLRLARLRTPIEIKGHLRKPSFGINAGSVVKQGAVAAALGAIATPLAAALAFVDPGLAKNADCAQLLAEAKKEAARPPPPGAPKPPS